MEELSNIEKEYKKTTEQKNNLIEKLTKQLYDLKEKYRKNK